MGRLVCAMPHPNHSLEDSSYDSLSLPFVALQWPRTMKQASESGIYSLTQMEDWQGIHKKARVVISKRKALCATKRAHVCISFCNENFDGYAIAVTVDAEILRLYLAPHVQFLITSVYIQNIELTKLPPWPATHLEVIPSYMCMWPQFYTTSMNADCCYLFDILLH